MCLQKHSCRQLGWLRGSLFYRFPRCSGVWVFACPPPPILTPHFYCSWVDLGPVVPLSGCLGPAWPLCLQNQGTEKDLSRYSWKNHHFSLCRHCKVETEDILGRFQPRGDSEKQLPTRCWTQAFSWPLAQQPSIALGIRIFQKFYCGKMIQHVEWVQQDLGVFEKLSCVLLSRGHAPAAWLISLATLSRSHGSGPHCPRVVRQVTQV